MNPEHVIARQTRYVLQLAREWREHDRKHHSKKADNALAALANAIDVLGDYERTYKAPESDRGGLGGLLPLALVALAITGCMPSSGSDTTEPLDPSGVSGVSAAGASADTGTDNGIFSLHDAGPSWEGADGGLTLLPEDGGTDAQEPLDASTTDAATDAGGTTDAGHDAGPPPEPGKTCDPCEMDADCAAGYVCLYRTQDGVKGCFQLTVMGMGCPAGLGSVCFNSCSMNPSVCAPTFSGANTLCTEWQAAY